MLLELNIFHLSLLLIYCSDIYCCLSNPYENMSDPKEILYGPYGLNWWMKKLHHDRRYEKRQTSQHPYDTNDEDVKGVKIGNRITMLEKRNGKLKDGTIDAAADRGYKNQKGRWKNSNYLKHNKPSKVWNNAEDWSPLNRNNWKSEISRTQKIVDYMLPNLAAKSSNNWGHSTNEKDNRFDTPSATKHYKMEKWDLLMGKRLIMPLISRYKCSNI